MKNNSQKVREMAFIGLFVAMICVISQIVIPMPSGVPVSLQVFAVAFVGYFLGLKKAILSIILYIFIGFVGAPVFSGFQGGFGALFGPTGGFIWGFLVIAVLCGIFASKRNVAILLGILSVVACHTIGLVQYSIVTRTDFWVSFLIVSLPYILKDVLFIPIAYALSTKIKKIILP